jgi:inhibitor of growth protein 3
MATTSDPAALSNAYALSLLSEYTQALDSLPADVSRQFADLRELDAVLSASVHALTSKITRLIEMIETDSSPKEQRMWLLMEIADEAQRLRLGGEDKIRVAAQVADGLKAQNEHMTSLLLHIPGFNPSLLARHTVYPHIAPRSYAPLSMYENGRRRRGALLSTSADQTTATNKRRRGARDDDAEGTRTPRRERIAADGTNPRSRNGARSRRYATLLPLTPMPLTLTLHRTDRAGSPTESLLSVTSHQQQLPALSAPPAYANSAPSGAARPSNARNPANNKRRSRPAATPTDAANGASASSLAATGAGGAADHSGAASGHSAHLASSYATPSMTGGVGGWSGLVHAQLEGPGMPVARSIGVTHPAVLTGPGVDGGGTVGVAGGVAGNGASMDAGDGGDDGGEADDGRLYCWCQVTSYGDMVACDDNECKHEWVSPPALFSL